MRDRLPEKQPVDSISPVSNPPGKNYFTFLHDPAIITKPRKKNMRQ